MYVIYKYWRMDDGALTALMDEWMNIAGYGWMN